MCEERKMTKEKQIASTNRVNKLCIKKSLIFQTISLNKLLKHTHSQTTFGKMKQTAFVI